MSDQAELIATCTSLIREAVLQLQLDSYLSDRGAADYLKIGVRTFDKYRSEIPHFRVNGRGKRLYKKCELDAWLANHRVHDEQKRLRALVDEVCRQVLNDK